MRWGALLLTGVAMAFASSAAEAETTASFRVGADIVRGCFVSSDAGGQWGFIDLGTVDGLSTVPVEAALVASGVSGILVQCTPGGDVALTADAGTHAASGQRRLMREGGSEAIPYALLATAQRTAWTTQPLTLRFDAGSTQITLPVVARATLPGPMPAGRYSDTVRITLTW